MDTCPACLSPLPPGATQCSACGNIVAQSEGQLPMALPAKALLQGGKYQIEKSLGQGGFGITYKAMALMLQVPVAIKEYFPDGGAFRMPGTTAVIWRGSQKSGEKSIIEIVTGEARAVARFNHPGIVKVFDVFEENNTAYVVMELLEGRTLEDYLVGRTLSPVEVIEIGIKLAEALSVVHQQGILHRDLKPPNIFMANDRIVLIDFGSAREFVQGKTMGHTLFLTAGYAPLEQYASAARLGPYTDIYALGAIMYQALTGHAPPNAPNRTQGVEVPPLPPGIPAHLRRAVMQALEIKVEDRPQDTAAFIALLKNTPAPRPAPSPSPRPAPRPAPSPSPAPRPAPSPSPAPPPPGARGINRVGMVVGVVVAVVLGWLGLALLNGSNQPAQVAPVVPNRVSQPTTTPPKVAPKVTAPVQSTPRTSPTPRTTPTPRTSPTPPATKATPSTPAKTTPKVSPAPAKPAPVVRTTQTPKPSPAKPVPQAPPKVVPSSSGPKVTPLPSNPQVSPQPVVQPLQTTPSRQPQVDSVAPSATPQTPAASPNTAPVFEPLD